SYRYRLQAGTYMSFASVVPVGTGESGELVEVGFELEQAQQHGIALPGDALLVVSGQFVVDAVDELGLESLAEVDLLQIVHPHLLGRSQMVEQVAHPTGPAGQVLEGQGPEDGPPEAGTVGDRRVDVGHRDDSALDE